MAAPDFPVQELASARQAFERFYAAHLRRLRHRGNGYAVWVDASGQRFTLVLRVHGVTVARRLLPTSGQVLSHAGRPVEEGLLIVEALLGQYLTPPVRRWGGWVAGVVGFVVFFFFFYLA